MRALAVSIVCALAAVVTPAPAFAQPVHYDIAVHLEPATRVLEATARITVKAPEATTIALARTLAADYILVDGEPLTARGVTRGGERVWPVAARRGGHAIEIRWRGIVAPIDLSLDHRGTLGRPVAASGPDGTFLPSGSYWYPVIGNSLGSYRVAIDLPAGQRGIVAGRLVEETVAEDGAHAVFEFAHPAEGIDLMAGPYRVETRAVRTTRGSDVALRTYFAPEIAELSKSYLDAVQGYIDLYEARIGPYPFTEFSVVSSPTPTGFGMPTLTYLGESVLRLPFIRATSLGHEVLHNWWGNGVYPDLASGNWAEGLTTFMADYAYKEQAGDDAAREMRLGWLRDLAAVPPGHDQPLRAFTARTHGMSQIVGYNKSAMVFLMLRDTLGTEAFDRGLRRFWLEQKFRVASWRDLQRAFEAESGRDLAMFFTQWLEREGLPSVRIAEASRATSGGTHLVRITLAQDTPAYGLRVPLRVQTEQGDEMHTVQLASGRQSFEIEVRARPTEITLDPEFRILRRLDQAELPPILRQTMVAPAVVVALAVPGAEWTPQAKRLAGRLIDAAPVFVDEGASLPRDPALLVIGRHAEVDAFLARNGLPARPPAVAGTGSAQVWAATRPGGAPLLIVSAGDLGSLGAVERLVPHYGRQSYLVFAGRRIIARGVWPSPAGGRALR
ncbi:MAG: M1 family peptidase [Betaproteobacteria bacterium]|nr:M1 family peptidase [Betaproteobacteria bacterium]